MEGLSRACTWSLKLPLDGKLHLLFYMSPDQLTDIHHQHRIFYSLTFGLTTDTGVHWGPQAYLIGVSCFDLAYELNSATLSIF